MQYTIYHIPYWDPYCGLLGPQGFPYGPLAMGPCYLILAIGASNRPWHEGFMQLLQGNHTGNFGTCVYAYARTCNIYMYICIYICVLIYLIIYVLHVYLFIYR